LLKLAEGTEESNIVDKDANAVFAPGSTDDCSNTTATANTAD